MMRDMKKPNPNRGEQFKGKTVNLFVMIFQ